MPALDYCSILTKKLHVDSCGTAPPNTKYFLFVEKEKPWPENEKGIPEYPKFAYELADGNMKIHLLAPGSFSKKGFIKVLFFKRSDENIAYFSRKEFLVPESERDNLIRSLFSGNTEKFSQYENAEPNLRDIFICGHAAKDYCCGTFGDALFQSTEKFLSENQNKYSSVKTWQTSHLKGHKFAPTVIDFPEGRFWAHVTNEVMTNELLSLHEKKSVEHLKMHLRGLAGTNNFGQIAERELFLLYGPEWIEKKKTLEIQENPENKNEATVTVTFDGENGKESKSVKVGFEPETISITEHACNEAVTYKKLYAEL